MEETNQIEQEIVIVGSRYGDFTDVLEPYYEKGEPIEPKDIENILGSTTVYLQRMNNTSDPYAVGVFLNTEMQLGFVWKDQSFPLYEWMLNTDIPYVIANIKRVISRHGIMIADVVLPFWLKDCPRKAIGIDMDWARNIPLTVPSVKQQSLNLAIALLCDELPLVTTWSDSLKKRIENVNRYLPSDLSAKHIQKSLVLYEKMRMSPIKEVRDACDDMLNAMVSRGSEKNMKRWAKKFLPEYFNFVSESELFGVFEAANYTLERVEELLNRAPDNLFYSYKFDRVVFAFRLYYASLPEELYDRLLMLLAVREAMLEKEKGKGKGILTDETLTRVVEKCQGYFWGNSAYAVLFCVCRDDYDEDGNKSLFEQRIEQQPYKKDRVYKCPTGTIANAFRDNPIYNEHVDTWEKFKPMTRIIKLRDALRKELI